MRGRAAGALGLILCAFVVTAVRGAGPAGPAIGIIIDDLGNRLDRDLRAVTLPGALTYAFLPHSPYTPRLARLAHGMGKEVMVHLPMQSVASHPLGDGGLRVSMSRREFLRTAHSSIRAVPHASGVNNHMGSLLTQHRVRMGWLMEELRSSAGLFFVDSHTTRLSVAREVAEQSGLPAAKRDVFIDAVPEPAAMRREFERLLALARDRGTAIAIAHPYPQTLDFLEARLPQLAGEGVELVPISTLVRSVGGRQGAPGGEVVAVKHRHPDNDRQARSGRPLSN